MSYPTLLGKIDIVKKKNHVMARVIIPSEELILYKFDE